MNTVLDEAVSLAKEVAAASKTAPGVDVAVCVPFPFIMPVKEALAGSKVVLGAQDCYFEESGAYTAAVSTAMLKSCGVDYVVASHSERWPLWRTNKQPPKSVVASWWTKAER